ncbi:hypothetical protein D3C80_1663630 [compost metagenome]
MIDQHHDHIRLLQRFWQLFQRHVAYQRFRQLFHVRLNDQRFTHVPIGNQMGHFHRRTFTQIVDIWLEGQAETGNFHF